MLYSTVTERDVTYKSVEGKMARYMNAKHILFLELCICSFIGYVCAGKMLLFLFKQPAVLCRNNVITFGKKIIVCIQFNMFEACFRLPYIYDA